MAVTMKPIKRLLVECKLVGLSPYVSHAWSEKARKQIRDKHAGKKTKARDTRDPEAEAKAATYFTRDGKIGIPAMAIKKAIITAAHRDIGIDRTMVRKAVFLHAHDDIVLPVEYREVEVREDCVPVGQGTDLRYRPEIRGWSCDLRFEIDGELLRVEDFVNLVNRAGFGVGIGEMRPEKNGENGRFKICEQTNVHVEEL